MALITRMTALALRHGYRLEISTQEEAWVAQPLYQPVRGSSAPCRPANFAQDQALQTNGYDCGVWVLCVIAAVLRGYAIPAISETHLPAMRRLLCDLVLSLPYN